MIFKFNKHNSELYSNLLSLSRNIFFYKTIHLSDNYESRIYLMFIHFSLIMIIFKKKGQKFYQDSYDSLFNNIENNLRELGFGDVSVNKKMKDLNKILYDILLKVDLGHSEKLNIDKNLIFKYFKELENSNDQKYMLFEDYFKKFYDYCFDISLNNMIRDVGKFKYNYGSS